VTAGENKKDLIIDSISDVLDLEKLQEKDMLSVTLYRCLDMYYSETGEEGLENILRMWDDISRTHSGNA